MTSGTIQSLSTSPVSPLATACLGLATPTAGKCLSFPAHTLLFHAYKALLMVFHSAWNVNPPPFCLASILWDCLSTMSPRKTSMSPSHSHWCTLLWNFCNTLHIQFSLDLPHCMRILSASPTSLWVSWGQSLCSIHYYISAHNIVIKR